MDDHIAKPVAMAALTGALARWIPESGLTPRRRAGDCAEVSTAEVSTADKFRRRLADYAVRLEEIKAELKHASVERRAAAASEAVRMAHNLAGTAAMFGREALGNKAAEVEDDLASAAGKPDRLQHRIEHLIRALREAA